MIAEIEFVDGVKCDLELIYNWNRMHIYRCEDCYLLVPYKDVVKGVVTAEQFQQAQAEAKQGEALGSQDLGKVLYTKTEEKVPCKKFNWVEVQEQ